MTPENPETADLALPIIDTDGEATADHPDGVDDDEAEAGHAMYLAVDDLDDESNGVDQ